VLGFGRIGQQVARRALGLGMRVIAYDPFVSAERFRELGVERVEATDDVYAAAEFLTVHLPLTAETRVGRPSLRAMKARLAVWQAMSPIAPVPKSQKPRQSWGW